MCNIMICPKNPVPPGTAFVFDHCVGQKKDKKVSGGAAVCQKNWRLVSTPSIEARAEALEIPRESAEDGIRQVITDGNYPKDSKRKAAVLFAESRQCLIRRCKSSI